MKHWRMGLLVFLLPCLLLGGCGMKKPATTTTVVVWNYYSGKQKEVLDALIAQFNETVGVEKGIVVTGESKGGVDDLADMVTQSVAGTVGAEKLPQVTAAYGDSAYDLYRADLLVDYGAYLSEEELATYVPAFLHEGEFSQGSYYILPVAKSTELLYLNATDWDAFAGETGADSADFATWEGLAKVAVAYYNWSGGKALFGRDAFANYPIVGSHQLGKELFSVTDGQVSYQMDETVLRRLWAGYAAPYLKGHFSAYGRFRSDDTKTGDILSFVGSTSSVTFFSPEVTDDFGNTRTIEQEVYPLPTFQGERPLSVQQGAGMCVLKSDPASEAAAVEFLRWFTAPEQNLSFCASSGYLPVTLAATNEESMKPALLAAGIQEDTLAYQSAMLGIETVQSGAMYASAPFVDGAEARTAVNSWMTTVLDGYRGELDGLTGRELEQAVEGLFTRWVSDLRLTLEG